MMVHTSHLATPLRSPLWPACTASTIVTELMMRMKVIRLTKARGRLASPAKGKALNTWLGSGQELLEKRTVPYEMRKAPKVNASLIKKYHIISFPYSRLKGLLPPFHQPVFVCTAVVSIFFISFLLLILCQHSAKRSMPLPVLPDPYKKDQQVEPEHIYKMPVGAHNLYRRCIIAPAPAEELPAGNDDQAYDPPQHVQGMQAENNVQELSRARAFQPNAMRPHIPESRPLQPYKHDAQQQGCQEKRAELRHGPLLERTKRGLDGEAAEQHHGRRIPEHFGCLHFYPVGLPAFYD